MKAAGIICEYNPFHNGHIYHIEKTRAITRCDVVVCVMSGNFVQRGEPAIVNKWIRTKEALHHGVDLMLELPFPFATQSAVQFAQGAVQTLALANVSDIVFGSETNDLSALKKLAHLDSSHYTDLMAEGLSAAKAYEIIYGAKNPNDILAINYIRAMEPLGIQPHTIQRTNAYHSTQLDTQFASAGALRQALFEQQDISAYTPMRLSFDQLHCLKEYETYIIGLFASLSSDYLHKLFLMDEGIENHFKEKICQCEDLESLLKAMTSKRYPTSRIRRTLIHLLHQTTKADMDSLPPLSHIRILGFNAKGRDYLRELKTQSDTIIASRINQIPLAYRKMELKSAHIYGLFHERKETLEMEVQSPIRI